MTAATGPRRASIDWSRVTTGDAVIAAAERATLGTMARMVIWPPDQLDAACARADEVLATLDRQASRFRPDSELTWVNGADGGLFMLSDGLAEAIGVALAAARWTGGWADPTIGQALIDLGYDRDFAAIRQRGDPGAGPLAAPGPAPGWQQVRLDGPLLRLPPGLRLDLGATAKGLGADRAVRAIRSVTGPDGGVLISLGGDIAVAGTPPRGGWPVTVAENPDPGRAPGPATQLIRLAGGAVATSSVGCRRWRRAGTELHHIVDPSTGWPADGPWRTITTTGTTCADANAASTAAIVAGPAAEQWLTTAGVPARLVGHDGRVLHLNGWPAEPGQPVPVPRASQVYRGVRRPGRTR